MATTIDGILGHLDTIGADVTLKRDRFSASRKWVCHLGLERSGVSIHTCKLGDTASEALDAATQAFFDVQANGMPVALPAPEQDRVLA